MLRRNIKASIALVNGATGVLKEVIRNPLDGEPVGLRIQFDGEIGEHVIEKVSATFNISKAEAFCRQQFPVVIAFACTVHKGQGLHLVDLEPGEFTCPYEALQLYNKLRTSIGLPSFGTPLPLPTSADLALTPGTAPPAKTPAKKKQWERKPSTAKIGMRVRPPKQPQDSTPQAAIPQSMEDSDDESNGNALHLTNTGRDCFAIAAIILIHSVPRIRDDILITASLLPTRINNLLLVVNQAAVLSCQKKDVRQLRIDCNRDGLQYARGRCADELFHKLAENFPLTSEGLISMTVLSELRCASGHTTVVDPMDQYEISKIVLATHALPAATTEISLDEFLRHQVLANDDTCYCGSANRLISNRLHMGGMYLRVTVMRHHQRATGIPSTRNVDISGRFSEPVNIFGHRLKLIAGIQHLAGAGGVNGGHYVVWRREERGWLVIDDSRTRRVPALPPKLRTMNSE